MKEMIRSLLQRFGYDIVKYKPVFTRNKMDKTALREEFQWLRQYDFASIIDIGANEGQFSDKMRLLFPDAFIYAFEPLPGVFSSLNRNFSGDPNFKSFNLGLGDQQGEFEFSENEYSPSSSFLNLSQNHISNFEEAVKTNKVKVFVQTLDEVFQPITVRDPLLVKMDVQGFEDKVIGGGMETLSRAKLIICELSFVELYSGQALFENIYNKLSGLGFIYAGNIEQLRSPQTNQILQADGIFIKQ
jgi:FkbM family methyltransferase